jgi:hypothetical protein
MVFNCKLCDSDEYVYSGYLCSKCTKIQDIIKIYSSEKVVESLEYIFVRGSKPIKNRTEHISTADSTYLYHNKDNDKQSKL